jgi:hypothetical protein
MKHLLFSSLVILCVIHSHAQTTVGLVAYWRMNGNYTDAGPNLINGTNFGSTATTNNKSVANSAMGFSNPSGTVAQYATHPVNAALNFSAAQNFTVSFSFYLNSPYVHPGGFYENNMNYNGYGIWLWQSGGPTDYRIQFNFRNNSVGSTPQPLTTWKHVTAVRNGTVMQIYINGILNATGTTGTQTPVYTYPGRIGSMFFNGMTPPQYNGLHGKMDEVRIYNRALTAAEILALSGAALPVKLTSFTGVNNNNTITLNWQTQYEQNSSYYSIQRSTDGVNFTDVGRVQANGNSNIPLYYSYNDILPASVKMHKTVFYKLKAVDIDGSFGNSDILALQLDKTDIQLLISPNPAKDVLQVQTASGLSGNGVLTITDVMGRQVYRRDIVLQHGSNNIPVNISLLGAGMYHVRLVNGKDSYTKQFVKE